MIVFFKMYLAPLSILVFLLITFGISVIEKVTDWKGTIGYITENFKNTIIKKLIAPLIGGLLFLEIITCGFLIIGFYQLLFQGNKNTALFGCGFSALCILYMLTGQRIAKDYVGATSLTVYFILTVFGIYLLTAC